MHSVRFVRKRGDSESSAAAAAAATMTAAAGSINPADTTGFEGKKCNVHEARRERERLIAKRVVIHRREFLLF